jgi:hypothetical protein
MAESLADRVLAAPRAATSSLDDDQLAFRLGASSRQAINQVCRRLEAGGRLRRQFGPDGKLVNALIPTISTESTGTQSSPSPSPPQASILLSEDEVKAAVKAHLESEGPTDPTPQMSLIRAAVPPIRGSPAAASAGWCCGAARRPPRRRASPPWT